jgi:uncharacterized protein DUF4260
VTRAALTHRIEYLGIFLLLAGAAIWQKDQLGWPFWFFVLAPDLFGFVPASLLGRAPARGHLPPRGVWLYNIWHTYTVPIVAWVVVLLIYPVNPWPLLGWLAHISADRLFGFGLRGDDGGQAVF